MIQFNLLPDVKMDYIKAKRTKRLIMAISIVVGAAALLVTVMLFVSVRVLQRQHMSNLTADIDRMTQEITSTPDINKILTVQNQLGSLTPLHDQKPVTSRLFDYLAKIVPNESSISRLQLSFVDNSISLSGQADSLSTVNKVIDTLKFTKYRDLAAEGENRDQEPADLAAYPVAFSGVVLASYGLEEGKTSYNIELIFDPLIFASQTDAQLLVPKQFITTRSETEKPRALFDGSLQAPAEEGVQ